MKKLGEMNKLLEEIWWRNMWTRYLSVVIPLGIGLCELSGTDTSSAGLAFIGLGIGFFGRG